MYRHMSYVFIQSFSFDQNQRIWIFSGALGATYTNYLSSPLSVSRLPSPLPNFFHTALDLSRMFSFDENDTPKQLDTEQSIEVKGWIWSSSEMWWVDQQRNRSSLLYIDSSPAVKEGELTDAPGSVQSEKRRRAKEVNSCKSEITVLNCGILNDAARQEQTHSRKCLAANSMSWQGL